MRRLSVVALLLTLVTVCAAQTPQPVWRKPSSDVYLGYVLTATDYGSQKFNGAEAAYSRGLSSMINLTGSGVMSVGNNSARFYSLTAGPKVYLGTRRLRPYVSLLAGFSALHSPLYDYAHHPPIKGGRLTTEDGFSYRLGAGADWQLREHLYWRVAQMDWQPEPWAPDGSQYLNFSSGVGYRF